MLAPPGGSLTDRILTNRIYRCFTIFSGSAHSLWRGVCRWGAWRRARRRRPDEGFLGLKHDLRRIRDLAWWSLSRLSAVRHGALVESRGIRLPSCRSARSPACPRLGISGRRDCSFSN